MTVSYAPVMNILSIQSHVAYGHVGNAASTFALQRMGVEVWPVHTVQFSNHTGYGAWRGRVFDRDMIRDVVQGIEERGVLGSCDGVLSGYMGDASIGEAILDAVARVKRANSAALYCCDPVVGDVEQGIYVRPGVMEFMRERAMPAADIVTPNQFELERLSGHASTTRHDALAAVDVIHALGPRIVIVTSLHTDDTPAGALDLLVSDGHARWRVRTPRLPVAVSGTGDLIAALFLAHYLRDRSLPQALARATASVFGILRATERAGSGELLLIAAQNELVAPSQSFEAERL
jgi:pyridoxine kinase